MHEPAERQPTCVRFLVVLLCMVSAILLYLDRFCISFAESFIREDLNLTNDQVAWLLSAAMWTYALAQVPSGFLSDRFGARSMLTLYILCWSLFTALTGLALGFAMLLVWRFGFGAAQAGAYPTSAALIGRWVPTTARGKASSVVAFGGRIGGFLAPILTAFLIVWFVPPSVSSRFEPDDILDYPWLSRELARSDSPLGNHILTPMSSESRAPAIADLVKRLNDILDRSDFYRREWFADLELPREANALLAQSEELTREQQQRLNRLLLEAAFPQGIRKVYVAGWRPVMITFGLAGLVVAALFWICARDRPQQHPRCNRAEVELIAAGQPRDSLKPQGLPWKPLLSSVSMWLMCGSQLTTNIGWFFLVSWLPRYFTEVHRVPIEERAFLVSIPIFVGWFGMVSGGWLTDRLTHALGVRWGRALPLGVSRFAAMAAYVVCMFEPGPCTATVAFSIVAFSTDLGSPSVWAFNLDVGGRYVGSILGWGNMFGNFGAALSPPLLNYFIDLNRWDLVFLTCALAFCVSGICALGTNAAKPIRLREAAPH